MEKKPPKAFISYSWSSDEYCKLILSYAERLVKSGIDIVIDRWDLSVAQDKYYFMEKMVNDPSISHVIIFSDRKYAEKADERKAGVGTESQIISKEVYDKVDQKKFIPVVCQMSDDGEPCLPVFLRSRIWIDFSTPELTDQNWEVLICALKGEQFLKKPPLGEPSSNLLSDEGSPVIPTTEKFASLQSALLESKPTVQKYRKDFLKAAIDYADKLRVRKEPEIRKLYEKILKDLHTLLPLRDQLVNWLLLEAYPPESTQLNDMLIEFLESALTLKDKPEELTTPWNNSWFDAHALFVYELFLYFISVLLKENRSDIIRNLLTTQFYLPESPTRINQGSVNFEEFRTESPVLRERNNQLRINSRNPIADLIKERATHPDISFSDIMQSELVLFLSSILGESGRWCPHTLIHSHRDCHFRLFIRAEQHKGFEKLKTITGVISGDDLRQKVRDSFIKWGVNKWAGGSINFWESMNMDALDTKE